MISICIQYSNKKLKSCGTTKKTRLGNMYRSGDVVLAQVQFTDTFETKTRPAVVLFEELGNIIVVGVTSNISMKGIALTKKEGTVTVPPKVRLLSIN